MTEEEFRKGTFKQANIALNASQCLTCDVGLDGSPKSNVCTCGKVVDMVNHPPHYERHGDFEPIKVIEAWGLDFHLGNTVKYISRAGAKGDIIEDLEKARWYLDRRIELLKAENERLAE